MCPGYRNKRHQHPAGGISPTSTSVPLLAPEQGEAPLLGGSIYHGAAGRLAPSGVRGPCRPC